MLERFTCPNCGHEAAPDEERCNECSLPLTIACPECGTKARADAEECDACGHSLAHASGG